jgi:hypothetical protein
MVTTIEMVVARRIKRKRIRKRMRLKRKFSSAMLERKERTKGNATIVISKDT